MLLRYLLIFILIFSCTKNKTYRDVDIARIGAETEKSFQFTPAGDLSQDVYCGPYGEGCMFGKFAMAFGVRFIIVQFETEKQAKQSAYKINQYYARNWVFDDVMNEPVLEQFVQKAFDAKNPRQDK